MALCRTKKSNSFTDNIDKKNTCRQNGKKQIISNSIQNKHEYTTNKSLQGAVSTLIIFQANQENRELQILLEE